MPASRQDWRLTCGKLARYPVGQQNESEKVLKGILVNGVLAGALRKSVMNQKEFDNDMFKVFGTPDKSKRCVNAILGVSKALVKAAAQAKGISLYRYLADW